MKLFRMNESNFTKYKQKKRMKRYYKLACSFQCFGNSYAEIESTIFCIVTVECTISNKKNMKDETNEVV